MYFQIIHFNQFRGRCSCRSPCFPCSWDWNKQIDPLEALANLTDSLEITSLLSIPGEPLFPTLLYFCSILLSQTTLFLCKHCAMIYALLMKHIEEYPYALTHCHTFALKALCTVQICDSWCWPPLLRRSEEVSLVLLYFYSSLLGECDGV